MPASSRTSSPACTSSTSRAVHSIDQDALRIALDDGRVALATLDTVDPEPLPAGHWMYEHPGVRLSAHVSWYTPALQRTAVEIFVENLGRFLRGDPLLHVVDPAEGY